MQRTDFLPGIFLPEERFAAYGPDDLPLIELFYFDAGGGHRSAATALKAAIEQAVREERFPPCRAEMVNLQDMLENVDRIHRATQKIRSIKMQLFKNHPAEEAKKFRAEDVYNTALKHGWTFLADSLLRGLYWGIAHYGEEMAPVLEGHFRSTRPGMVVSVIPNFNHIADPALQAVLPGTPYVTIPTDLSDLLPKKAGKKQPFWLAMNRDQYVINGTPELHAQAMATGFYEPDHVIQVDGMILKPGFYRDDFADREETLRKLGLDPGKKTTLITFGGHGSAASIGIAKRLERSGLPLQNIVICGRNEKLFNRMKAMEENGVLKSTKVFGFVDMPLFMHVADVVIGKPGPGIISEAIHMGCAILTTRNAFTMPQELPNTYLVEKWGVGIAMPGFWQVATAMQRLFGNNRLEQCQRNARAIEIRALHQIPGKLAKILRKHLMGIGSRPSSVVSPSAYGDLRA